MKPLQISMKEIHTDNRNPQTRQHGIARFCPAAFLGMNWLAGTKRNGADLLRGCVPDSSKKFQRV
jgi:hypothetical protein